MDSNLFYKAELGVKDTAAQDSGRKESGVQPSAAQVRTASQAIAEQEDAAGQTAAKQDAGKRQPGAKSARPEINQKHEAILAFLRGCSMHEADAFRVMADLAHCDCDVEDISAEGRKAVNAFLNYGLPAGPTTMREVQKHRQQKASALMPKFIPFVSKEQFERLSRAFMAIIPDYDDIEATVKQHNAQGAQPVANNAATAKPQGAMPTPNNAVKA